MSETVHHSFGAEVSKVLKLMIHSLYKNHDIFLRELISNASDACDKLRYEALTTPGLLDGDGQFRISVRIDKNGRELIIEDNGIGMNETELVSNLGTIARSGTQEFLTALEQAKSGDVELIGQFGVGFYSAFIVADKVVVESTRAGETQGWRWESEGEAEFRIQKTDTAPSRGTRVTLHIKEGQDIYLDKHRLTHIIQTYSDHIAHPIELIDEEGKSGTVNSQSALWTRPKNDVTPEQYREFYHHVAHSPDEPWAVIHNRNEGAIEYTNLLFIPSIRAFDIFHPDRIRRVKLYVKRVFITDQEVELVPHYLRFLRGVVDCEDLPLNVSRETLQQNPVVDKIRSGLTKRVLSELKKKLEADAASYDTFWKNYGPVLKEGLCEATAPRQEILEVCRFPSTHEKEALTTFDAYIERMKENQPEIYYLCVDSAEEGLSNPVLEGFTARGIEVLLFTDTVDDFWVNVVHEYKGRKISSVTRAGIDFNWDKSLEKAGEKTDRNTDKTEPEHLDALRHKLCELYGELVLDVRQTDKLTGTPAILTVQEGQMDIRMERFLYENKQIISRIPKILEVNPNHPVIARLAELAEKDDALFSDAAWLLLDQAMVIAGEEVPNPGAFARRLTQLLEQRLCAA